MTIKKEEPRKTVEPKVEIPKVNQKVAEVKEEVPAEEKKVEKIKNKKTTVKKKSGRTYVGSIES